jgi:O-antigen ligase
LATAEQRTVESGSRSEGSETFDLFCERGILAIVVAALVYAVLAFGGVRTFDFTIFQGLTVLGLVLWVVRMWAKPRFRLLWPPISWAVVAFVIYAIVRCATDSLHYPAREELSRVLTFAGLFFLASNNLTRRDSATIISMALVCVALGVSALAIYQFASHSGRIWGMYKPSVYLSRASGTFINPNHLAGFLELVLPLTIAYLFMGRMSAVVKVLLAYCAMMMIAAICLSLSRGGMLATAITLVAIFLALLLQRDFWLKAALALALVTALIIGGLTQMNVIERRFGSLYSANSGKVEDTRVNLWRGARATYVQEPIFGPGPGHFDYEFRKYATKTFLERAQYAHNDYLNALCDWGAVGLAMLLTCAALLYRGVMRTWPFVRRQPNEIGSMQSNKGAFVFGAAFSILAILLHSFTDFNLHIPANAAITVVLAGLLTAHWRFATERFWLNPRVVGKIALTLCIAALCFAVSKEALKEREEAIRLDRAQAIADYGPEKQAALERAWEIAPDNFQTAYEIGECLRIQSWEGQKGYEKLAQQAMTWYDRAMALNPYDPYSPMRFGMCLDWLDKRDEAGKYFEKSHELGPNDFTVLTYLAWHQMQLEHWKEANTILRSALSWYWTETAQGYLDLTERRLAEKSLLKY